MLGECLQVVWWCMMCPNPQPTWVWAWTWSPSIFPFSVGLDLIPLQFPPWVWAWTWSPSTSPLGVGLETQPGPEPPGPDPPQSKHPTGPDPPGAGIPPREQNSWHTLVKILPSFAGGNKYVNSNQNSPNSRSNWRDRWCWRFNRGQKCKKWNCRFDHRCNGCGS